MNLPAAKYDKLNAIEWKPRRWQWVAPLKDTQANVIAVANGFKSRQGIISEAGGDIEDVLDEIAADILRKNLPPMMRDLMSMDFMVLRCHHKTRTCATINGPRNPVSHRNDLSRRDR